MGDGAARYAQEPGEKQGVAYATPCTRDAIPSRPRGLPCDREALVTRSVLRGLCYLRVNLHRTCRSRLSRLLKKVGRVASIPGFQKNVLSTENLVRSAGTFRYTKEQCSACGLPESIFQQPVNGPSRNSLPFGVPAPTAISRWERTSRTRREVRAQLVPPDQGGEISGRLRQTRRRGPVPALAPFSPLCDIARGWLAPGRLRPTLTRKGVFA